MKKKSLKTSNWNEYMRNYNKTHPQVKENQKNYYKRNPWLMSYFGAKSRCNNSNNDHYSWYGAKGIKFLLTMNDIKELWFRDKAYLLSHPTIDRKDEKLNYTIDNCQFIERKLNSKFKTTTRHFIHKEDKHYFSTISEVCNFHRITRNTFYEYLKGERKNIKGYTFEEIINEI